MTEQEWLSSLDPLKMIERVIPTASERKLRLLACACATVSGFRLGEYERRLIQECEQFSDEPSHPVPRQPPGAFQHRSLFAGLLLMMSANVRNHFIPIFSHDFLLWADQIYCSPIRDIFGNPFRPVSIDPSWLTEAVVGLASGIYIDRAFERMPILADAMQDAGCTHDDILNHCREPGTHVRGCWVVDLILGKD